MNKWISGRQKPIRKTMNSHQKDNMKHDDGMNASSHARETAGGGRGAHSNADDDVPMSILQQRHTSNAHQLR